MNTIKCPCGKRADVTNVSGYWWEVFCKTCKRYVYGGKDEMDARVKWLRDWGRDEMAERTRYSSLTENT